MSTHTTRWPSQHRWGRMTIYQKILALYFVCIIPVVLFGGIAAESHAGQVRTQVLLGALQTADIAVANVTNFVEAAYTQIQMLALTPSIIEAPESMAKELFVRYLSQGANLDDLILVTADGRIIAQGMSLTRDSPPQLEADILGWLGRQSTPTILHGNDWFVGRQRPIIVAHPVRRFGQNAALIGVVAAWRMYRALSMSSSVQGAEVFLTDEFGDVIAHPNWMFAHENTNLRDIAPVSLALLGGRGTTRYVRPDDQRIDLAAYASVPRTGWAVVVNYPEAIVLPPVRQALARWLGVLLVVVGVALAMAAVVAGHLARPLEALTRGAEALAEGDFSQRVAVVGTDEVSRLSARFNHMATSLEETTTGLTRARAELTAKAGQLERLLHRSVSIQEEERRRIALDLHDGLMQVIVGVLGGVQAIRQQLHRRGRIDAKLGHIEDLLKGIVSEVRHIVYDLRPPTLETAGLLVALRQCLHQFQHVADLECRLDVEGERRTLPPDVELSLYRACQESLQNVVKHARASQVFVTVHYGPTAVQLSITDDGRGFTPGDPEHTVEPGGLGLLSIRERVEAAGGMLEVRSAPGSGTALIMLVPYRRLEMVVSEVR